MDGQDLILVIDQIKYQLKFTININPKVDRLEWYKLKRFYIEFNSKLSVGTQYMV
jgi:hypothetical protein